MGIAHQPALDGLASDDLIGLGMEADAVRRRLHPEGVVTYAFELSFDCSLAPADPQAALQQFLLAQPPAPTGTGIVFTQLAASPHGLDWLATLLHALREQVPNLRRCGVSAADVLALADRHGLSPAAVLERLHAAGLEALADSQAPADIASSLSVHRAAHQLGMRSTAALALAALPPDQQVAALEALYTLQQQTGGLDAFVPLVASPAAQPLPTAVQQLKSLAIARLVLDNVASIRSCWRPLGPKVLQLGLRFGADDAGSLAPARVDQALFASRNQSEEELRRIVRDAGLLPVQRDPTYSTVYLN